MASVDHVEQVIAKSFSAAGGHIDGYRLSVVKHRNGAAEALCTPCRKVSMYYRHSAVPTGEYVWEWEARRMDEGIKPRYRRLKTDGAERKQPDVERASRRAKKRVRELIAALDVDHMLTLTYRENMQDTVRAKADWERFVRLVRAKKKNWVYVVVPEIQERGAIHFHAAVRGRQDVKYLRKCWYAVVGDKEGNIDVQSPYKRWGNPTDEWKTTKLAGYLTKYLTKSFSDGEAWAKRYWSTKLTDENRPVREVYWIQGFDGVHVIQQVYEIVAGSRAIGVVQHLLPGDEIRYWLSVPPLPPDSPGRTAQA